MLDVGIRFTLDDFIDLEASIAEMRGHFFNAEQKEIDVHSLVPPIIELKSLVSDVEGQEQQATRLKCSPKLT